MIRRQHDEDAIRRLLRQFPVVAILGARQVGKSTLARQIAQRMAGPVAYFDLENPNDQARLREPMLVLSDLRGLIVVDEVQHRPDLFAVLRVLADRPRRPARFLVLGSASPELLQQSSESLAGRIAYHELDGFALDEVGIEHYPRLWLRGGFPRSYLARSATESQRWRQDFIRTFLERDLPQLGITVGASTLRRFWTMIAHYHGQVWNASEIGRSFGVADTTVRHYLDILTSAFVVRQLAPWFENLAKRQVKAPKVFVRDCGLLHSLLNLTTQADLEAHPKLGASWEGFAIEEVIRRVGARPHECFFWATYAGAELDLLVVRGRKRFGFEIKRTAAPQVTPSMRHAFEDLRLTSLDVIHAGEHTFPLRLKIRAVAMRHLLRDVRPMA